MGARRAVAGIVLAAGLSERFGEECKLLAPFRGRPLVGHVLDRVAEACAQSMLARGFVVHGPQQAPVASLIHRARLTPVLNRKPEGGIGGSLAAGLAAAGDADAALIFLGDQPLVRLDVMRAVLRAGPDSPRSVIRPYYGESRGGPGHPVLLPRAYWRVLDGECDEGFRPALERAGVPVISIPVVGSNPDVDTPEDLASLEGE